MKPKTFMLIAGEASGDLLAAELVAALRGQSATLNPPSSPVFFGAGGPKMAAAGVELAFDLTQHSVIGLSDVLKNIFTFRRLFNQLLALAIERKPDVIIGVDYGGFNLRFGHAVRKYVRDNPFSLWNPKIVQFVSPQVWASRPRRAQLLEQDYDLLLSIFPFEKDWYARHAPTLRVEFVGHPMVGRFNKLELRPSDFPIPSWAGPETGKYNPLVVLLPGSRKSEIARHLPLLVQSLELIRQQNPVSYRVVVPKEAMPHIHRWTGGKLSRNLFVQGGGLAEALSEAGIAIASTGTVTMECAFFGVPTVTLYKTSWLTYQIAKRIVTVKSLTMPNLLAGEAVYPEFIQHEATPQNLSRAALELLQDESRRQKIKAQLANIIASLGEPGAPKRAAAAILSLFNSAR